MGSKLRALIVSQELCQICKSLHLGVHRFKVGSPSFSQGGNGSSERMLRSSTTSQRLGSLLEIRTRSSVCPFCALVRDSVEEQHESPRTAADQSPAVDDPAEQQLQQAVCTLTWEIDGREAASSRRSGIIPRNLVRGLTRRIHLRWNHPRLSDAYLVYVAPETYSWTTSDADRVWDKGSLFLGRSVSYHSENQALIKSWLDLCQATHRGPCRHKTEHGSLSDRFYEMISSSYFGVVDVINMQLTGLPGSIVRRHGHHHQRPEPRYHEPYVALSYVWGIDKEAHTTLTNNVMLHRMHGGLERVLHKLPRVIQDAISLVQRLGFQYLWIDRLCIVQDSPRSWKLNAYNMDLIYGNAELTICAADGDASAGLRAMRSESHNTQHYARTICPGMKLFVKRSPETYIRASWWNERAWTFQERLLSRRCLIFTNGRVYFQCRSTGMSEDIYADRQGAGWSLDLVDAPMQMFRQIDHRAIWVYMRCVELYTERKLTQPNDILAAFSGMSNLMRERMAAPFIHGLPSSHFDLALLWEPLRSSERRMKKKPFKKSETPSTPDPEFPSWSWAGWMGTVAYKESIVGGLLDNVSDWLDKHTWIKWWIRDGHGDLRPLWDNRKSTVDKSKETKWRGYQQYGQETIVGRSMRTHERYVGNHERYDPDQVHSRLPGRRREGNEYREEEPDSADDDDRDEGYYYEHEHEGDDRYVVAHERSVERDREGSRLFPHKPPPKMSYIDDDDEELDVHVNRHRSAPSPRMTPVHYRDGDYRPSRDRKSRRSRRSHSSDEEYDNSEDRDNDSNDDNDSATEVREVIREVIPPPSPPRAYLERHLRSERVSSKGLSRPRRRSPPAATNYTNRRSRFRLSSPARHRPRPPPATDRPQYMTESSPINASGRPQLVNYAVAGLAAMSGIGDRDRDYRDQDRRGPGSEFFNMIFADDGLDFSITLKDYPYRVVKAPYEPDPNSSEFPLLPILQFRTWHTWLHVKAATGPGSAEPGSGSGTIRRRSTGPNPGDDIGRGQVRCHIADEAGDWCGSIVLDAGWLSARASSSSSPSSSSNASSRYEFIAISEAKSFTQAECRAWTYYIPKEREQSEWDLFYVLLIERKDEKWERVGLGKVFREAFRNARWKEIVLG